MEFLHKLLLSVLCVILIQGAQAIDIGFSASNGGESVAMSNTYLVDDSVSVSESASATFDGLGITDSRDVFGSGDAYLYQELQGTDGGNDWTADHTLWTVNTAILRDTSSASLKPASCQVSRSSDVRNSDTAATELYGHQGRDHAGEFSYVSGGDLSDTQNLAIGNSVEVSHIVDLDVDGQNMNVGGQGYSKAWNDDGSFAEVYSNVICNGVLNAYQTSKADGNAKASASVNIEGEGYSEQVNGQTVIYPVGYTYSIAKDTDNNIASTSARVWEGTLTSELSAEAGNSASASQVTDVDAVLGRASGYAENHLPAMEVNGGDPYYYGSARFGAVAPNLHAEVKSSATLDRVDIDAETNLDKKAIILEPFHIHCGNCGQDHQGYHSAGDVASHVLEESRYATWQYTDSAATEDRFEEELGKGYDVALISAHMSPNTIGLSTGDPAASGWWGGDKVTANELENYYAPSTDSLVVLEGCSSLGDTGPGTLYDAVSDASVVVGFPNDVYIAWAEDSIGQMFLNLRGGGTLGDSMNYVNGPYRDGRIAYYGWDPSGFSLVIRAPDGGSWTL